MASGLNKLRSNPGPSCQKRKQVFPGLSSIKKIGENLENQSPSVPL